MVPVRVPANVPSENIQTKPVKHRVKLAPRVLSQAKQEQELRLVPCVLHTIRTQTFQILRRARTVQMANTKTNQVKHRVKTVASEQLALALETVVAHAK